jgi:hypothetical protein
MANRLQDRLHMLTLAQPKPTSLEQAVRLGMARKDLDNRPTSHVIADSVREFLADKFGVAMVRVGRKPANVLLDELWASIIGELKK